MLVNPSRQRTTSPRPGPSSRQVRRTETLIVGAGPAGLAVAACLAQRGIEFVLLERSHEVGSSWRRHYERLHLHTVKEHSSLPDKAFSEETPRYPSRTDVIDYLDDYAAHFGLKPWFGVEVLRARRVEEEWRVETNKGEWRAPNLVMATGFNRIPHRPRFSGQTQFRGPILHSCDYRNGAPFHGQRVAVIGSGNSGAEIAVDLHEHGAETKLVVRSPVHIAARTFMGLHAQKSSISLTRLPNRVANAIMGAASSLAFGDLSAYGLRRPAMGAMTQIKTVGRIPIIDAGLVAKVKAGDVGIVPGIESFGTRSINFVDGRELPFDAVIMATGYRTGLQLLLDQSALYTDPAGRPLAHGAEVANAGIFFLGYANPPTGTLREISLEAPPIANAIWSRLQERRQASNTVEALNWHPSCL